MKHIILASTSPRRKEIFDIIWLPYTIMASNYEEDMSLQSQMSSTELALLLSRGKWDEVVSRLSENAIVIAADTFIVYQDKCLGKPHTIEKQKEMLQQFSGQVLDIKTGIYIHDTYSGTLIQECISSQVIFKKLTDLDIERYLSTNEWLDKAWGFAVQLKGNLLIDHISGDWYNIMWLPLKRVYEILQQQCWIQL